MTGFVLIWFAVGIVLAIPVWIALQHAGTRRGLQAARHFDPRDAVPCLIEPVALNGRLLPQAYATDEAAP